MRQLLWAILLFGFSISHAFALTINEFVPDASIEWIEFYNASDSAEYIKSYYIDDDTSFSDDSGSTNKKSLSTLNSDNIAYPYIEFSSMLNNSGDYVVLFDDRGYIIDQYQYGTDPGENISIGRSPDGSGGFITISSPSKGGPNPPPPTPTSTPTPTNTPVPTSIPPTNTPAPSNTPKPTSTPIPTKTPTPTPSPRPPTSTPVPRPTLVPVFSEESELAPQFSKTPTQIPPVTLPKGADLGERGSVLGAADPVSPPMWPAFVFIGLGLTGLGIGGFLIWKQRRYTE